MLNINVSICERKTKDNGKPSPLITNCIPKDMTAFRYSTMFDTRLLFEKVVKISFIAGFCNIGDGKEIHPLVKKFMNLYQLAAFIAMSIQVLFNTYILAFSDRSKVNDSSILVCSFCLSISSCSLIIFYARQGSRIQKHYKEINNFAKIAFEELTDGYLKTKLQKYSRRLNTFLQYSLLMWIIDLSMETGVKVLMYYGVGFSQKGSQSWWEVPFEIDSQYTFAFAHFTQSFSLFCMLMIQQTHRNYLFAVIILKTLCFESLRHNLRNILSDGGSSSARTIDRKLLHPPCSEDCTDLCNRCKHFDLTNEKLVKWVRRHNELLRLCKEFIEIYSPLLVSYFVVMFVILISGVFSITQNHHYYGLMEEILLGIYFAGIIFNLFMLSIAGSNLTFESVRTFEDAFNAPWYDCSRRVKSTLKVVCEVAKQPVSLAAFHSHHFNMSLHTFIWVMRAMVSFYIGLVQIKERSSQSVK